MTQEDSWGLEPGEEITRSLTAMKYLGGGSAYEVYLAFDETCYTQVVVKLVRPGQVADDHTLRGLEREVAALDHVNHPVVVRGLRSDLRLPRPHVVLEHVEGPRLSSLVRRYGRLQPQQYLPLALDVAAALHYFRQVDVVHLDIKPSNVIMGSPARLIDLSVARPAERARRAALIGTDAYMSPEQVAPERYGEPGYASDVWGLGATLFHAVAGRPAFPAPDPDAPDLPDRYPQLSHVPGPLPDDVPEEVAEVLAASLAVDAADRPLPSELADALEPAVAAIPRPRLSFRVRS
jgi:eukaryotic-like serine/threonine-protein kinase